MPQNTESAFAIEPLLEYPHREQVLALAQERSEAVDQDEDSPFRTLVELGRHGLVATGRTGSLVPQAAVLFDLATGCTATAFSLWAHRSTIAFFDAVDRELPDGLEDGTVTGSTAMAAAFKAAAGVGEIQVRARRTSGGLVLEGVVPWASNLYEGGVMVLPVVIEADAAHAETTAVVTVRVGTEGHAVTPMKDLMALDATRSGFSKLAGVRVPSQDVLTEDLPGFLARVSAPFLLLQASFCLGLSAASLGAGAALRESSHGVFVEDFDAVVAECRRLRSDLLRLAEDPAAAVREDVVRLRLQAAHLTQAATRLELMLVGGRGYVASSPTARRFREAAFLPVQSPTEGHLRVEVGGYQPASADHSAVSGGATDHRAA